MPCERHAKQCPQCSQYFCESTVNRLLTCFYEHVNEGKCQGQILRTQIDRLSQTLNSVQHEELQNFVVSNSDGLGNPLPKEVCINLGLAVIYAQGMIPEYNPDVVKAKEVDNRRRRTERQKIRRAKRRLNISASAAHAGSTRLASYKGSTFHVANAALIVRRWTGTWHYREQMEILSIMGLHKGNDFVRDRVDYLRHSNPMLFEQVEKFALSIIQRRWR